MLESSSHSWLSKPSRNVVFRAFVGGCREDLLCGVEFNDAAHEEEAGVLRHTRGLLHVVGHDNDRVVLFEREHQLFDLAGGGGGGGGGRRGRGGDGGGRGGRAGGAGAGRL